MYGHPALSRPDQSSAAPALTVLSFDATAGADGMAQLVPDGLFRSRDGRPTTLDGWRMSPQIAERVLARLRARQTPIVVDYEHQTILSETNGQPAPAAGWIDPASVVYRPGSGLYAPIKWTERARGYIAAGEYLYLSPVLRTDERTGEVLDLLHVALVNDPAVDGMSSVAVALRARFGLSSNASGGASASANPRTEDPDVNELLKKLAAALGLPENTTEAAALEGVQALKAQADQVAEARTALGVDDKAALPEAITALKSAADKKPDLSGYVPKAVFEETRAQLVALKANSDTAEIDRLIEEGLADGRIAGKATADYLRSEGLTALKAHLADSPSVAALKSTQTKGKQPDGSGEDGAISAAEKQVAAAMGLTDDQIRAQRG